MYVYVGFNAAYIDRYDMKIRKKNRFNLQVSNRDCCRRFVVFFVQSSLDKLRCRALKGNNNNNNKKKAHNDTQHNKIEVDRCVGSPQRTSG